jgi:regulator of protease activity HflC (stomatin/prohibitin superfamily)
MKSKQNFELNQLKSYLTGGVILLIGLFFLRPFAIVNAGERGVVMRFGKVQDTVFDEGLHFILPIVNSVQNLTVRVQKNDVEAEASSKDLQDVRANIAVNWHIDPEKVNQVFQRIGDQEQIVLRILNPAVSEVVKAATAKKTAEQIITMRTELKQEIDTDLRDRLKNYGLMVDDVSLVDISFSEEFAKAIESKQIAEQEAKQADFVALKAAKEAQAQINRAKGQAESQRLQKLTLTKELLQQQAIEKWDGKFPMVMGGNGSLPLINLNPNNFTSESKK